MICTGKLCEKDRQTGTSASTEGRFLKGVQNSPSTHESYKTSNQNKANENADADSEEALQYCTEPPHPCRRRWRPQRNSNKISGVLGIGKRTSRIQQPPRR